MMAFISKHFLRLLTLVFLFSMLALPGCTSSQRGSYHSFTFNGWHDKWATEVELLEYDYGGGHNIVLRKAANDTDTLGYRTDINATMPNGDYLYVKWRIQSTREILESKVDLRGKLPNNMTQHRVTFVIDGRQLYVYLITPILRKPDSPQELKTWLSSTYVSYEIYPSNTFKK